MGAGDEMIGKIIGDYQIEKQLGEGGMGVVFKGVHPTLGQVVAIKMLHPNLTKADAIKQRFVREAQAMARLRHPNILQLYNFIESAEGCFIVMEFVEGKTFESILEEKGVIPPAEAIELFLPSLAAMKFAHDQQIIHRDIKPSNIMLLNSGVPKIMDFGTAKMAGAGGPALTAAGMTLGTVVYMSPEQLMGRDLTPAADIYSLGVTLFEMCTGRLPFYHENEMQLMKMIMKEAPPKPTSIYPGMPKSLENAILKSIEKDRAKRYQTADEFAKALELVKKELGGGAPAAAPTPAPQGMPPSAPPGAPKMPTPPAQPIAPPEDTQTMKMPPQGFAPPPGATTVQPAAVAPPTKSPLVPVGGGIAALGLVAGGALFAIAGAAVGGAVMGSLLVIGVILLVVGLGQQKQAPGAAAQQATAAAGGAPAGSPAAGAPALPPVQPGMAFLDVIDGSLKGQRLPLGQQPMTLGRAPDNNIVFKDPSVSSHHGRIDFYQGKYFLSDLQSSNGTYVNNARIEQTQLNHQDLIAFGSTRVIISIG